MSKRKRRKPAVSPSEASPQYITVDGFEGDKARVELPDGSTVDWDRASLPDGTQEGDVIKIKGEGQVIEIDHVETARRSKLAQSALDSLNADAPKGEITL